MDQPRIDHLPPEAGTAWWGRRLQSLISPKEHRVLQLPKGRLGELGSPGKEPTTKVLGRRGAGRGQMCRGRRLGETDSRTENKHPKFIIFQKKGPPTPSLH